jgi:membrane protein DedA with SNARE-associated domain
VDLVQEFFRTIYNVPELIRLVGLAGVAFIIFAETGLMVGFFLPGDSLLVTAGIFAAAGLTIILAQFMPIVRTFAPVVAGAAGMTYRRFATFNVVGAVCWIASMTLTGFLLGSRIPDIDKRIHLVVAVVIFLSLLPAIISILRAKLRGAPSPETTAGPR